MPAGSIDPASGQYIYGTDDPRQPMSDVLNLAQNAAKIASTQDRARITLLEDQVLSAYGAASMTANVAIGPEASTVPFNQARLAAGVARSGAMLVPQSSGVYLVSYQFSGVPSTGIPWRDIWVERLISGVWTEIPLTFSQCGLASGGNTLLADAMVPVSLNEGEAVRLRTTASSVAPSTSLNARACYLALVKVSG